MSNLIVTTLKNGKEIKYCFDSFGVFIYDKNENFIKKVEKILTEKDLIEYLSTENPSDSDL